jgi:hypothetical protein
VGHIDDLHGRSGCLTLLVCSQGADYRSSDAMRKAA